MAGSSKPMEVVIENARLIFKNFKGAEGRYNKKGDANFCVVLPEDVAKEMAADGWNVKVLEPRDEGDEPTPYLPVAVSFKNRPPRVVLIAGDHKTPLTEDSIDQLDYADIITVDVMVRSYHWEQPSGATGIKAYLKSLFAVIEVDPLEAKYADVGAIHSDADYQEPDFDD